MENVLNLLDRVEFWISNLSFLPQTLLVFLLILPIALGLMSLLTTVVLPILNISSNKINAVLTKVGQFSWFKFKPRLALGFIIFLIMGLKFITELK